MSSGWSKAWHQRLVGLALLTGLLFVILIDAFAPVNAATGINQQLNFQGRLLNSNGAVVPDGTYNLEFKIYQDGDGQSVGDSTGSPSGTLKWTEDHLNANSQGVTVKNGYLSVQLGSVTAFGSSVDWNQDTLWLSVNIGNTNGSCTPFSACAPDGEMIPMKRLSANPYALNAGELGGLTSGQFVQLAQGLQTDAGNSTNSIAINKTGTGGNFLDLQASGTDAFVLTNSGDISFGANANHTISVTTAGAGVTGKNLTVSAGTAGSGGSALAGGNLVLQGGTGGGTNGNGGNVTLDAGAPNGSGSGGTINIGTTNAATVNVATNGAAHTVAIANGAAVQTVTIGSTTSTSSVVLQAGTGNLSIQTQGGTLGIGTNAVAQTLAIGNSTGATAVSVDCGTGNCTFGTTATAHTTGVGSTNGSSTLNLQAGTGGINLGVSGVANTIQIGNTSGGVAQTINIGTNNAASSSSTVVIGSTVAGNITLQSAATINIGQNAAAQTINVGNTTGATGIVERIGTGNYSLDGVGGSTYTLGASTTTGSITIGGTAQTGPLSIGTGTGVESLSFGTGGTGAKTVTVGSTASTGTTTLQSGSGGVILSGATSVSGSNTFSSGTGAVSLQGATTVSANLIVTNAGNFDLQRGSDYSTTGSQNNVNLGTSSLVRLTGASAQTITGIANGADGRILTLINAASQAATLSNLSGSSSAANQISTGSGIDLSLQPGGSISLIYDAADSLWRVIGMSTVNGTFVTLQGATPGSQQTGNINVSGTIIGGAFDSVASGTLALGTANASTINIGTNNTAHTIAIGSGGSSTAQAITIGSATNTTSTLALQAGNGSTAISLQTGNNGSGAAGGILIGNTSGANSQVISIGTNATASASNTIHIGDGANAQQIITIGSTSNASSTVTIGAGTGTSAINLNANTAISANNSLTFSAGTGAFDAHNASGSFQTTTGANSLNGATTVTGTNPFTVNGGLTTLNGAAGGSATAVKVNTNAASNVGLNVQGASSQTANLLQLQDANGINLVSLDSGGNVEQLGYNDTPYGGRGSFGNLLIQSEAFDAAAWSRSNVSAPTANNVVAPDTNTTAESLADSSSGGSVAQSSSTAITASSITYTFSVWLKASGAQTVDLRIDGSTGGTGTKATVSANTTWQRFSVSQAVSTGASFTGNVKVLIFPGGTGGSGTVSAWGAQLVAATTPGVYVNTLASTVAASTGAITNGNAIFIPVSNSTTAVQLQNASGTNYITGDATNGQLVLGTASSLTGKLAFATAGGGTLTINPTSNASSFTLTLPAENGTVCTDASTSACNTSGALTNVAYLPANQSFTGQDTFSRNGSGASDYTLGLTGTPTATNSSALLRLGGALTGGNNAANGGTYFSIVEPNSGAGSAADFLNFQNNTTVELQLTSGGNLTVGGTYNTNTFSSSALAFGANSAATISSNGTNNLTVDTGSSGGTETLGNNAATTNLASSNAAHTVHIGDGGSSTAQTITIGSATNTTSSLTLQGGNGTGAITLQTGNNGGGTAGTIVVGNTTGANSQSISIGTNATNGATNIVHLGDAATAQDLITIGSTSNTNDAVTINAGSTGGVTLGATTLLTANSSLNFSAGTGGLDAHSASGSFQTSSGANSLNGATTVTGTNTFTVNGGLTTLNGAGAGSSSAVKINTNAASNTGLVVQGASAQTANLLQLQDSTGANVVTGDALGNSERLGYLDTPFGGLGTYGNLLVRSEDFGTTWSTSNVTVTTNDGASNPAPDSTTTADKLVSTAAGGTVTQTYSSATNTTYTFSVWLKTNSSTAAVQLRIDSNGVPATGTAASYTATTTWQRFSVSQTFTSGVSSVTPTIIITNNTTTVVGWGAQLVQASTAGVYVRTVGSTVAASDGLVDNGTAIFQNSSNTTTAFQVQNASATNLLAVDTSGSVVSLGITGSTNANSTVHIADSSSGVQTVTIGSNNSSSIVTVQAGSGNLNLNAATIATNQATLGLFNANATTVTLLQAATSISAGATTGTFSVRNANTTLGNAAGSGVLTNNGATVNTTLSLSDFATGGAIGTAAATVDIYTSFSIAQTTASQALTIPSPTANTTYGRTIYLSNIGSASFTLGGIRIPPGDTATLMWSHTNGGDSWQFAGAGASSIENQNTSDQVADFRINGTGRANTSFISPLFDSITGALSLGTSTATGVTIGGTTNTTTITLQGSAGVSINLGNAAGSGVTTNNGAMVNTTLALGDFSSGGAIGTAANTVDKYTSFSIAQTTASQALTIPSPTAATTYGRTIYLSNVGTASFTLASVRIPPGDTGTLMWSNTNGGASWQFAGAGASSIENQNSFDQTADFRISGTGRANTSFTSPLFDSITGALSLGTSTATGVTIGGTSNTTSLLLQGAASATYTVGTANNTGGITVGNSTANNTISIGAVAGGSNTQTINIGNSTTASSTTNITLGSTIAGTTNINGGTGININGNAEHTGYIDSPFGGLGNYGNLIKNSEQFDNSQWVKTTASATADQVASPDNNTTADTIHATSNGGKLTNTSGTAPTNNNYTFSVWLKTAASTQQVDLRIDGATSGTGTANRVTATTTWQRFSVTQNTNGFTGNIMVAIYPGTTASTDSQTVYAWGAQLVLASTPQVYVRTVGATVAASDGIVNNGTMILQNATDSAAAFQVFNASGTAVLTVNNSSSIVQIGSSTSNANTMIFALNNNDGTATPTEVDGGMYYNNSTSQFLCGENGFWVNCGVPPRDHSYDLYDEFMDGNSGSLAQGAYGIGSLNWFNNLIGVPGTLTYNLNPTTGNAPAASSDRPGILNIEQTGTGNNTGQTTALGNGSMLLPTSKLDLKTAVNITAPQSTVLIGLHNETTTTTAPTTGVYWKEAGGGAWNYCYVNGSNAETCAATATNATAGTWYRLEIQIVSSSEVDFYLNGTKTAVTGITYNTTNRVAPAYTSYKTSGTPTTQDIYIDYFELLGTTSAAR